MATSRRGDKLFREQHNKRSTEIPKEDPIAYVQRGLLPNRIPTRRPKKTPPPPRTPTPPNHPLLHPQILLHLLLLERRSKIRPIHPLHLHLPDGGPGHLAANPGPPQHTPHRPPVHERGRQHLPRAHPHERGGGPPRPHVRAFIGEQELDGEEAAAGEGGQVEEAAAAQGGGREEEGGEGGEGRGEAAEEGGKGGDAGWECDGD